MSRLTRLALAYPRGSGTLLLALSLAALAGLPRLSTDVGYRAFLGPDHPTIRRFDAFLARFDSGLPLMAVWSCEESPRCESVFDPEALRMADAVARRLAASPAVRRVRSPANAVLLVAGPAGPQQRRLLEDGQIPRDVARLSRIALRDPLWVGQLVSANGRVGAIVAELRSSESVLAQQAYSALDEALAPYERAGFHFQRVGGPVEFVVAGGELASATAHLIPLMVALVGGCLLLLFRSARAAAAALFVVGLAVLWTLGLEGWLGWAQNSLEQALPPLILVIGVCDGIHMVARYADEAAGRSTSTPRDRARLIRQISGEIAAPCTMTSLTTAAGFASFQTSDLASFARFGWLACFGVLASLLLTFSLLPLLLRWISPVQVHTRAASRRWDRALGRLVAMAERRSAFILSVALTIAIAGAWGTSHLRVDASFEELYGEQSQVVQWAHFVQAHLTRPDRLEVDLQLPPGTRLAAPATLEHLKRLSEALTELPGMGPARSLLDLLDTLRRALPPGVPAAFRTPAALLALVSRPGGPEEDGLAEWVDASHRHLRISVATAKSPQEVMRRVMRRIHGPLQESLPPGWRLEATGPYAVVHDMVDAIRATQLRSFLGAGLVVALLLAVFLRSLRWSLLAMLPTLLPVLATLGLMGALGRPLDVGSAMVAAVVLGIAVDDAIHMLHRLRGLRRSQMPWPRAVRETVHHVGRALVTTSIALAVGFAALALSPWQSVANFGLISSVAILGALLADLLVLPALLLRFGDMRTRGAR